MLSHFYAYMARMKLIQRWGLRRNTRAENDQEHSLQVAMITHALCVIRKTRYNGEVDELRALQLAIYHEAPEVITGDLASPIKYFNPGIKQAFKGIEKLAAEKLFQYLPEDLRDSYRPLLFPDEQSVEWKLVKAADKISAYLKCVEEVALGNREFSSAQKDLEDEILSLEMNEAHDFMQEFAPSFALPLDVLN